MKRLLCYAVLICLPVSFFAENRVRLLLKSGSTVNGQLVAQTEEVYMVQDDVGQRLQYPAKEVVAQFNDTVKHIVLQTGEQLTAYLSEPLAGTITLLTADHQLLQYPQNEIASIHPIVTTEQQRDKGPGIGVQLTVRGGGASFPAKALGSNIEAGFAIGYRKLSGRHFFVGAGVDFLTRLHGDEQWTLLPLFARAEYYFLPDKRWSPTIGIDAGYAFALKGPERGGPMATLAVGARYETGVRRNHVQIGLYCKALQSNTDISETLQGAIYQRKGVRGYIDFGIYLSVLL